MKSIIIVFLFPLIILAQQKFDVTGRVSLQVKQVTYDEKSEVKPDSISDNDYSKTSLIPGLQQSMNFSLFGRKGDLDMTLLADITNNDWNKLSITDYNTVSRLTLNLNYRDHELVIGDFFQSDKENFILSREIRGLKYSTRIEDVFGKLSFLSLSGFGGITQAAVKIGTRLENLYKQFETSGQYRRLIGSGNLKFGRTGLFDLAVKYLQGEDDRNSISGSINDPFANSLVGAEGNVYFWERKIRLFGDFYQSKKDTLDAGSTEDNTYSGGVDFKYKNLQLMLLYQRIGYNYYTMGYPYLENDKNGFQGQVGYIIPRVISINTKFELYENNLDNIKYTPTNTTNRIEGGFTTLFPKYPGFTFNYGVRTDKSESIPDKDSILVKTDKISQKFELKLSHNFGRTRLSLSALKLNLDDKSKISSGSTVDSTQITPLGTDQFITSFNFYSQVNRYLFFSGGIVYSALTLTNDQINDNFYVYESNRWDIVPRKLKLETTVTAIINDAKNGGVQDYLSDYYQLNAQITLEYFFSDFISLKIIAGTDARNYKYNLEEALNIISNSDYGPTYFNNSESYSGLILGGEFNWNF